MASDAKVIRPSTRLSSLPRPSHPLPWQVEANRRVLVKEGGVRGLVLALGRHGSKEYAVHAACRALGQLIFDNPRTAQARPHPVTASWCLGTGLQCRARCA